MSEVNKERLMSDIKTVLADAEDLLKQAASATGERASELRETALTRLKQAKEKAADVQVVVVEKGKKAARATDDYVHEHPWASIGIAAGAAGATIVALHCASNDVIHIALWHGLAVILSGVAGRLLLAPLLRW